MPPLSPNSASSPSQPAERAHVTSPGRKPRVSTPIAHTTPLHTKPAKRATPALLTRAALLCITTTLLSTPAFAQFTPGTPVKKPDPKQPAPASTPPAAKPTTPPAPTPTPPPPTTPADTIPAPDPSQQIITTINVKPAAPPTPPVVIPPSTWKPGQPIKTADDLLSALESADTGFKSLQSDLQKTKTRSELEGGGDLIYTGRVMFQSDPPSTPGAKPSRRFQVDFTSITSDGVKRAEQSTFIFDGQWFVERQPDVKQIRKRRIVPPGETIDPLAIGEGPFPIPIGQKRERILQRFTAELRPVSDFPDAERLGGVLPPNLKDTYQLKLVPRPGAAESKQFQEVRIWYRTSDLLPRIARTVDRDDAINVFNLTNIKLNEPLPKGTFDVTVPSGWDAQVDEYRKPAEAP